MARRDSKRPINSIKHIIDTSGSLVANTPSLTEIIEGQNAYAITDTNGVPTGSTVNSFFLNVQIAAKDTVGIPNVYMIVYKNPGSNIGVIPNANNVGVSDFKKQIFHQEMQMTEKNTTAIPRTLFKGVLRVPRHMRRIGADDTISVQLFAPTNAFDFCLQCIYKHYS